MGARAWATAKCPQENNEFQTSKNCCIGDLVLLGAGGGGGGSGIDVALFLVLVKEI